MIIDKLNDSKFYGFASQMLGINILLYRDVLELKRSEKGVKIKMYLGGEKEDERKFYFQDSKCVFVNNSLANAKQDVTYDWLAYILECAEELSSQEKQVLVDNYNNNLEEEIRNYASQKREQLISI